MHKISKKPSVGLGGYGVCTGGLLIFLLKSRKIYLISSSSLPPPSPRLRRAKQNPLDHFSLILPYFTYISPLWITLTFTEKFYILATVLGWACPLTVNVYPNRSQAPPKDIAQSGVFCYVFFVQMY